MAASASGSETSATGEPGFVLTPPEPIKLVDEKRASQATSLPAELADAVDDQVERFISALLSEDVHSDAFRAKVDSAFRLGREEIAATAHLMSGRFMARNMVGMEDSTAFKAISEMRRHLDELDPGKEGDLLSQNKLLGMIPYGDKLKAYFRRFQSASQQLQTAMRQIYAARDDLQRDGIDIDATRVSLWEAMQHLKASIRFAEQLDGRLAEKVAAARSSDPERAKALEQEVLYYARQNLQDMLTQMAVCVNGYLAMDVLKKTCRELINGCERVATTGMSALAVAQTVARATGNQVKVMDMLSGVNSTIENMIVETGKQLNTHVERSAAFGGSPLLGIEKLKEMFALTFKAMDTMDSFRSRALEVMGQNNAVMRDQLAKAQTYLDKSRQEQIRALGSPGLEGPVRL
ncbi:MAG: toxic anion resistance protein [Candidatus Accumulibacter meliphilus]|jgi:uncharacterized protein YaaN involved in tellurite resistance|uniref:Toxic anion resistance protein n=1 Tax=Candidatus Accumulibacter meliphilus TaxID=2211374 RepID=A0A369XNT6_9PROT|nr:MAG: toxic anion resistance protein [Candidatus Accumulibacter meliphilus]